MSADSRSSFLPRGLFPSQPAAPAGGSDQIPPGEGRERAALPPAPRGGGDGKEKAKEREGVVVKGRQAAVEAADRHSQGAGWKKPAPRGCLAPRGGEHAMSPVPCAKGAERPGTAALAPSAARRPTQHHADHVQRHEGQPRPVKHAGSARPQPRRRRLLARRGDSLGPRGGRADAAAAGRGSPRRGEAGRGAALRWETGAPAGCAAARTAPLPLLRRSPGL